MGFWSSVTSAVRRGCDWVKDKYQDLKEKGREICDRVADRISDWTDRAERKYEEVKEKIKQTYHETKEKVKDAIKGWQVRSTHPGYVPTKPDQEAARKAKDYLDSKFRRGVKETLQDMTSWERVETIKDVVNQASEILNVKVDDIELYAPDEFNQGTCGYFNREDNTLHINAYMITCDRAELVEEQVYTVFHELMHARQFAAVTGKKDYGYPPETLLDWAQNFKNYISPGESDEGYRHQPLERDAFGFEAILKGEFTIEEFVKHNTK